MAEEPTLETPRLILRPFQDDDAASVLAYASNPEVARYMTFDVYGSLTDAERFLEAVRTAPPQRLDWAVLEQDDPTVFGAVELWLRDGADAEVHYALDPTRWGRGLATEAVGAVLGWAFRAHPTLRRIVAPIADVNHRSIRVAEKCRMTLQPDEPVLREKAGIPLRFVTFGVTREAWSDLGRASG